MEQWPSHSLQQGPSPGTGGQYAAESLGVRHQISEQKHGFGEEGGKVVINVVMLYSL